MNETKGKDIRGKVEILANVDMNKETGINALEIKNVHELTGDECNRL
jgi:hypothetical protein